MSTWADNHKIPFGKFKGKTLDQIGSTPEGLRYLDWALGQDWLHNYERDAIATFLSDPAVKRELDDALDDD